MSKPAPSSPSAGQRFVPTELACSCVCGAVRFRATLVSVDVHACHCRLCRKWSGGIAHAVSCDPAMAFEDGAAMGVYASSEWAERGFCKFCGSSLFWRMRDHSAANIPPSVIDDPIELRLVSEFCVDCKPGWYELSQGTEQLTEAEMIARYAAKPGIDHA